MAKNYSYPRVQIHTQAKLKSSVGPAAEDTTVLFMPLITKKGPHEVVTPVHSLAEFVSIFGEFDKDSYTKIGQSALNAYNWLSNGGTLYVYRLNDCGTAYATYARTEGTDDSAVTTLDTIFKAKYIGEYYKDLKIVVSTIDASSTNPRFRVVVKNEANIELEAFTLTEKNYEDVIATSEYITLGTTNTWNDMLAKFVAGGVVAGPTLTNGKNVYAAGTTRVLTGSFTNAAASATTYTSLLTTFWTSPKDLSTAEKCAANVIANRLETPIDLIMDAGLPTNVKKLMMAFIDNKANEAGEVNSVRPDIVGIFDIYEHTTTGTMINDSTTATGDDEPFLGTEKDIHTRGGRNIAIYHQYLTISDEILTDKDIIVTPSYFLAKLLPYNDLTYGVQFPTAGIRRGVLDDVKAIDKNPTPNQKDEWFKGRYNYIEKTSREYSFMSQRTFDHSSEEEYTALSFLNNVRALEKMKKELERLGREYLFEFNDSVTLSQMGNVLNKYMTNWVTNRTLNFALVNVNKNPYSDEAVDITLNIRFNGTIEVISVDITIE